LLPYPRRRRSLLAILAAASLLVPTAAPAAAAGEKVVIIVGPVGGMTDNYRSSANRVADAATAAGATVTKVYSPSATWAKVRAAVNGADVVVYFGHGNGYPNPYTVGTEYTDRVNGWGLNRTTTNGDADSWSSTMVYCGEKALLGTLTSSDGAAQWSYCGGSTNTDGVSPATNFTMVYAQAHYAPGFGERYQQSTPLTTLTEAQQRVRNYSTPVLRLGGTYFATAYSDAHEIVTRVLTQPTWAAADIFAAGRGWSPSTAVSMAHPDVSGRQVWVQRTAISGLHFGEPDYWYAFAGVPSRTPSGGSTTPTVSTPPTSLPTVDVVRLAGADRYATAAAVSAAHYAPGVPVAYVATGANFPDALAAGAAAVRRGGPVLLVSGSSIPGPTATELARLDPAEIVVVGGTSIVSGGVASQLASYATTGTVRRLAGATRYATAAAISRDTFPAGVPVAYVATGMNFPDALAGVAAAGSGGGPVLLTKPDQLPGETAAELGRLRPNRIVILGGTSVISGGVANALQGYAAAGVSRLSGANRYSTAVHVSRSTFSGSTVVFIATGSNFPDALGGGPVAGSVPGPLLLVPGTSVPSDVASELQRLGPDRVVILGGTSVVSAGVQSQLGSLLGP
jgi:putative cell wall-binding protein